MHVRYTCPFVPAEWIAAHGLSPCRILPRDGDASIAMSGQCHYAANWTLQTGDRQDLMVLSSSCDQMRRVFDQVNETSDRVFLFNMPATWQTPASFAMYRQELERLGRFLMKWGGTLPQSTPLARAMEFYQAQRQKLRDQQPHLQNLAFFKRVQQFYQSGLVQDLDASAAVPNNGIRLALVGCPLLETHERIHAYLDEHGGRVVLDATSSGERSWPTEFNPDNLASDPALELARAYFYGISDVFRRPNTPLYDYLKEQCRSRQVQGILFWHYPWCDLWLAEVERMKTELVLPLIVLDGAVDDSALPRLTNRIGAFLEMLS